MANLLYLVHRLPYPPNKGDKVRSYHLLKHLVARHRVFVGTFIDDADDEQHLDTVRALCSGLHVERIEPRATRVASLPALLRDEALTLRYYRNPRLQRWVDETCARERIDATIVFSSAMLQYVDGHGGMPVVVDFVDVDSAKWTQYAAEHRWPLSWLYAREGRLLLAHERAAAARAEHSFFVTENEAALFRSLAPESAATVEALCNGVDSDYFSVDPERASPYASDSALPIVFTGAMDYWPNVDAVSWFARDVLAALRAHEPRAEFHIVGRNPTATVKALASDCVRVTGAVPDIRPYLQHAAVVVAPLRIARGIQNKVLEAMAMARPVVASDACAAPIGATLGRELLAATSPDDFVLEIQALLADPRHAAAVGRAGREFVLRRYSWDANLAGVDRCLDALQQGLAA
ncbi:TIGR03087 family PEP-CTERM/XrtA system glycosyltransferase [Piscinibacter koreensis]|uniref:TIGR03087 family PEP-CTERM/XrtA system glycosyltransferase n=1 Tax=Piscinibacter koreensis TaxID=2742824 RepID=A0A7Y6NL85_9BURK|nr:TIGR03087 family PEP-CTERM/XrtA system glycosyltransferase [Schlegelella koreensis]NUZ05141.1 TIGR03087 family PEP-CTERM/XrtA system glycosyltransferase [Schlegelella koreensis]